MASIYDILKPQVTTKVISQVAASNARFISLYGLQPGGSAELRVGHRMYGYNIFNHTRAAGTVSAPGTPATKINRQPVGRVEGTFPRFHESRYLPYEQVHNLAPLSGGSGFDEAGKDYITKQERSIGERLANWRSALVLGMLQGGLLYIKQSGDRFYFDTSSSGAVQTINWRMPSGNQTQLDMLGAGNIIDKSWADPSANIPLHCENIDRAMLRLCGHRLEVVVVDGPMWQKIINNDYVTQQAGISSTAFEIYRRETGDGPDGMPTTDKYGVLKALPWIEWWITNDGVEIGDLGSETFTPYVGANNAIFHPKPSRDLFEMMLGSEPIVEYDNGQPTVRMGVYSWTKQSSNPSGWEIFCLDNAIPAMYVPNAVAYGTVVF